MTLTAWFAVVAAPVFFAWRRLGRLPFAVTLEVAVACVDVGVHYVTDVVAGALLGGDLGTLTWFVLGCGPVTHLVNEFDGVLTRAHL